MKNKKYQEWLAHTLEDPDLTAELQAVKDDPEAINDRFYRDLLKNQPQVGDLEAAHSHTLQAHAKSPTGVDLRIDARHL